MILLKWNKDETGLIFPHLAEEMELLQIYFDEENFHLPTLKMGFETENMGDPETHYYKVSDYIEHDLEIPNIEELTDEESPFVYELQQGTYQIID